MTVDGCSERKAACDIRFNEGNAKFAEIDDHIKSILDPNPEEGALASMTAKIDSKMSWTAAEIIMVIFFFIIGGAYGYTALESANAKTAIKESNQIQDTQAEIFRTEIRAEISGIHTAVSSINGSVQEAVALLEAHREYTEGRKIEKPHKKEKEMK